MFQTTCTGSMKRKMKQNLDITTFSLEDDDHKPDDANAEN